MRISRFLSLALGVVILVAGADRARADGPCRPPAGLLHWWQADGTGIDRIGGATAVPTGGAGYAPGFLGQAFSLDGISYFAVPNDPQERATPAFTVSALVRRSFPVGFADPVLKKAGQGLGQENGWALEFAAYGDGIQFWVYLASAGWTSSNVVPLPASQWSHVAGVYDGVAVRIYVNGIEAPPLGLTSGAPVASSNELRIGGDPSGPYRHYAGLVDDVRIYGRALSPPEIHDLYAGCASGWSP